MIRLINISLVVFVLLLNACTGNCKKNNGKSSKDDFVSQVLNTEYLDSKSIFPDTLLTHFPKSLDNNYITHTEITSPKMGIVRVDLTERFSSEKELEKKLANSIAIYNSYDSCLLVANRFATKDDYITIVIEKGDEYRIDRECYDSLYPIPNFWQSDFSGRTECNLNERFKIYVIDSEQGIYVDDKFLSMNPYLPNKWQHGYSRGIAVNRIDKIAIYWVMVW